MQEDFILFFSLPLFGRWGTQLKDCGILRFGGSTSGIEFVARLTWQPSASRLSHLNISHFKTQVLA